MTRNINLIDLLERMAETGTAPADGCQLFGVGYEDAFERLKETYLTRGFERGRSTEKFVIGPFGSGKSHFSRQLMEIARDLDCVTAEVQLNKDLDFTQNLLVYREVAREVRAPDAGTRGIRSLLLACLDNVRRPAPEGLADQLATAWASGLTEQDFELESFARVAKTGLHAHLRGEAGLFDAACRWLSGEISDRALARDLSVTPITTNEHRIHGRRAMLSLFQLVRCARFPGTVVSYDEAEQGFSVDRRREERIHSLLQSDINAVADLSQGSALIVYALTPDMAVRMEEFPALQTRMADPEPGRGFFDGNTLAPRIDLTRRGDAIEDLQSIGRRLVSLLYAQERDNLPVEEGEVVERIDGMAREIAQSDPTTSNRRTMVKSCCSLLVHLCNERELWPVAPSDCPVIEGEV